MCYGMHHDPDHECVYMLSLLHSSGTGILEMARRSLSVGTVVSDKNGSAGFAR